MDIALGSSNVEFHPWKRRDGTVFLKSFAFDCETSRIDDERPWRSPPYVLGAACDGQVGYFVKRDDVEAFFRAHADVPLVFHDAAFDLAVTHLLAPELDIYERVNEHLVWDTQLLHRLYCLATEGHTECGEGQSTLGHCAKLYLNLDLPKDVMDSRGKLVRLSYGQWLGKHPSEIEPIYLEYLAKDAWATYKVYRRLHRLIKGVLAESHDAWGFVSHEWLDEQRRQWGPLTHHIQLKAAIVLRAITANGLHVDGARRGQVSRDIGTVKEELRQELRREGYLPGQPSATKALKAILRQISQKHRDWVPLLTPSGEISTSYDSLAPLADSEPFVKAYLEYDEIAKLDSNFLSKMSTTRIHPSFDVLKTTGRTSSFGELNAQNLPRDERVRSCFIPSRGHVFINADYAAIEMATLAQSLLTQFGLESKLVEVLNAEKDPHRMVAALMLGKCESEVTAEERQKAKAINFAKPGGMGDKALKSYARTGLGVELSDAEIRALSDAWFELFPEMHEFLKNEHELGYDIAAYFDLTPDTYEQHTGSRRFHGHLKSIDDACVPHRFLGLMCRRALGQESPETDAGRRYTDEELDYFWSSVQRRAEEFAAHDRKALEDRRPSTGLQLAMRRLADRAAVFTVTGRLRAGAGYTARHNNVFQGLAADGAKIALWKLWRAGYRIVNFVHDEVLVEVPREGELARHVKRIRRLMIAGMREVVPDVRVAVNPVATTVWSKQAKEVYDHRGHLQPWSLQTANTAASERRRKRTTSKVRTARS
jgi:DNA polymerase I-like protein with 3'-5' exonuclease and polymerase domains